MFGEACMFALTSQWGMSENKEIARTLATELILTPLLKEDKPKLVIHI